jgi:hypothetical protein
MLQKSTLAGIHVSMGHQREAGFVRYERVNGCVDRGKA